MSYQGLPPSVVVHVHGSSWPDAGTGQGGVSPGHAPGYPAGHQAAPSRLPGGFPHGAHAAALGAAGHVPPSMGARGVDDPYSCQKSMPDLWSAFLRDNFASYRAVQDAFGVSERAARKWWHAEGGVNGAHVVHALRILPDAAFSKLIAAE